MEKGDSVKEKRAGCALRGTGLSISDFGFGIFMICIK